MILISPKHFFLNCGSWQITDSSRHKQLVGVSMLAALQFQTRSFWQVIFFWCLLLFSLLLFFFTVTSYRGGWGGKSATLWDQAILLSGPENTDDSNKKENQLLFHFISTGKSDWHRNKGPIIIKFKKRAYGFPFPKQTTSSSHCGQHSCSGSFTLMEGRQGCEASRGKNIYTSGYTGISRSISWKSVLVLGKEMKAEVIQSNR